MRIEHESIDPNITALLLAEAIKRRQFDLILTGVESHDVMAAQVGVLLAMRLALPFAYAVMSVEVLDGGGAVRITKELGGGVSQVIDVALPAVLCIQTGIRRLSYPPLAAVLKAKRLLIDLVRPSDLGIDQAALGERAWRLLDAFLPRQSMQQTEFMGGSSDEAARAILSRVKEAL